MIKLEEINENNFYKVINLKLLEEQKKYIASNVKSLAECYLYRKNEDVFPYAILVNDEVIGFVLLYDDIQEQWVTIWRLMIDKNYQGQGYGYLAILEVEKMIKEKNKYKQIYSNYVENNIASKKLFSKLGYRYFKKNNANEDVVVKDL